ncbi:alanine/glycine:cation symporter family protein [Peribacillus frigoritolerans]|jgi:AGCS family alanine or glycine:cation symporter|uniref:alanine/glycine:cation symporter family protein n=1 Tax=Peribacillus frigoritolerans TaxID=450367 RepID=UPI00227ECE58|nr:alanine/glycine:cation symporter family protein [Peribacillus frigoritolerans]MCY9003211.1 alanine:cation symporter family protein [Peribacillus frigoritolerans]MED4635416.1 alanine/glycine:cation symporter family protein [Peribacillus frigoritolerans]
MSDIVNWLNGYVWSPVLVYLLLGIGLMYSILTRFVQVRYFIEMIKLIFEGGGSKAGVNSFQSLALSLGGRIGVGNIAGVATAISLGGPGAVFWMWFAAFLGSATSFVEITLTQVYKSKIDGEYRGGIPFYIEKGLNMRWFAVVSAILTLFVMGFLWPGVQANTVALALNDAFGITPIITGIFVVIFLGTIIFGGLKRIAKYSEIVVPFMASGYVLMCVIILTLNYAKIPSVLSLIFNSAFSLDATFGGIIGAAIAWGVQRGIYANGAGLGSETFESGCVEVSHPAKQGLVQAFSVYIDTFLICTSTAFMILVTGMYDVKPEGMEPITNKLGNVAPSMYTQLAVDSVFPQFGAGFLAIALLFFCFTTLTSYYYKAETTLAYLRQYLKIKSIWPNHLLKVTLLATVLYGSVKTAATVWAMGDLGTGALAWLNLTVVFFLTKTALKVLKDYEMQKKKGEDPVFDPVKLGIKGADFWEKEYGKVEQDIPAKQDKLSV